MNRIHLNNPAYAMQLGWVATIVPATVASMGCQE